jgi:hypothetical protein
VISDGDKNDGFAMLKPSVFVKGRKGKNDVLQNPDEQSKDEENSNLRGGKKQGKRKGKKKSRKNTQDD